MKLDESGWVAEMHGGRLVLVNRPGGGFTASIALRDAIVVGDRPAATPDRGAREVGVDRSGWSASA